MSSFGASLPDFTVPEKQRKEDWYKQAAQYYVRNSVQNGFSDRFSNYQSDLDVYNLEDDGKESSFLQQTEGGEALPATWANYSSIRVKINAAINQIWGRNEEVIVEAVNREAISRKLEERQKRMALVSIYGDLQDLENESGAPSTPELPHEPTRQAAEEWFADNYKDVSAKAVQAALDFLLQKYEWLYTKYAHFRNIKLHGITFNENTIVNGIPRFKAIPPYKVGFDIYATDDFLTDSSFWSVTEFMPIADVISQYKITNAEEKAALETASKRGPGTQVVGASDGVMSARVKVGEFTLSAFRNAGGERRVMVSRIYFKDTTTAAYKFNSDKHGNKHSHKVDDTYKLKGKEKEDGTELKNTPLCVWRKCTLIGVDLVKDFGIVENLVRSVDDLGDCSSPIQACAPGFLNARFVSLPSMVKALQTFKNRILYKMQVELNSAMGGILHVDTAKIPKGHDTKWVVDNLRAYKIYFYNSMEGGVPGQGPALSGQDLSASRIVDQYLSAAQFIDGQIELVTNITPAMVGQQQSANQGLGLTQTLQNNSILSIEHEYKLFNMFCERVLNHLAGLVKITFLDPDIFGPIVGDKVVQYFNSDVDAFLQDYGVFVKSKSKLISDENALNQALNLGMQQGAFGQGLEAITMFLKAAISGDVNRFITEAEKKIERDREAEQANQAALQQQQQEQQTQLAQQAAKEQRDKIAFTESSKHQRQAANNDQKADIAMMTNAQKAQLAEEANSQKAAQKADLDHLNANYQAQLVKINADNRPNPAIQNRAKSKKK